MPAAPRNGELRPRAPLDEPRDGSLELHEVEPPPSLLNLAMDTIEARCRARSRASLPRCCATSDEVEHKITAVADGLNSYGYDRGLQHRGRAAPLVVMALMYPLLLPAQSPTASRTCRRVACW